MTMAEFYKGNIPILDPEFATDRETDMLFPKDVSFGLVPRNYAVHPEAMFSPPSEMKLVDESDYDAYYDEQEERQSSLEHIYLSGPNGTPAFEHLDQNGLPDCWLFSTSHSGMVDILKRGNTPPRFNPHAGAVILGQFNGGWCGMSAELGREIGFAIEGNGPGQWPGHSRDRKYDTPALRTAMAEYKIIEEWTDLTRQVYDRNLTMQQIATSGFNNLAGPRDYSWWSHSVCGLRWVRIERNSWGQLILNSWKGWGRYGLAVIRGSQAIANGALSVRLVGSSGSSTSSSAHLVS